MAMEPNYARTPATGYVPAANALWSRSKFRSAILAVRFDVFFFAPLPSCGLTMIPKSLAEGKWRKRKPCWKTNDPAASGRAPYTSGSFSGWRRRIASRPGGVGLIERGLAHCAFGGGERVADLGCGPGVTLAFAGGTRPEPRGDGPFRRHASGGGKTVIRSASRGRLKACFRDACMDCIVCECVLSLSYTPERALGEMGRVLRSGGRLLLTDIVVREGSHGAGGHGCARGAVPADVVAERLAAGF